MSETFRTVRVPASSANLGPGFDALGLALDLYLTCRFRPADKFSIRVTGRDAEAIPATESNLICEISRQICGKFAAKYAKSIELEIDNQIPIGKGLGSSAAAVTAGIVIGMDLADLKWDRARVLNEAARVEGHPDNVAACVLGGVVAAAMACRESSENRVSGDDKNHSTGCENPAAIETRAAQESREMAVAVGLNWPEHFKVAAIVPDFVVPTAEARRVLPETYSREDTIFNLQRTALLVAALATGSREAFPFALEDRLHQPHRARLVPGLEEVTKLRAQGLLGCTLSGAGPSVLVFYERGRESAVQQVREVFAGNIFTTIGAGAAPEILWTEIDRAGYQYKGAVNVQKTDAQSSGIEPA